MSYTSRYETKYLKIEMIESIKKISNPLTIIAIFAGLAEISGTLILPFLRESSQDLYVWFLMGFPTLLIVLFFITLNFNHKVLYAPSDFRDEDNFVKLFGKPTAEDRLSKLSSEIETDEKLQQLAPGVENKLDLRYRDVIRRNSASTHYLAEELVITKLSQEFDEVEREVMLRSGRSQFLFDAVAKKNKKVYAIEVKYLRDGQALRNVRHSLVKIEKTFKELPAETVEPMTVLLAIATDLVGEDLSAFTKEIEALTGSTKIPYEIRVFNLASLEAELIGA